MRVPFLALPLALVAVTLAAPARAQAPERPKFEIRGVCLAALGRKAEAAAAFRAYLEKDASSEWAQKAKEQIAALER